jgi:hypothetical protein
VSLNCSSAAWTPAAPIECRGHSLFGPGAGAGRPPLYEAAPTKTTVDDGRHEVPANTALLWPHRPALSIAKRSAARTFGPLLGQSGPRELGGLDNSPGANWRRHLATTPCRTRRCRGSSLVTPAARRSQCQPRSLAAGDRQRRPPGSAWMTRKCTTQRPTPARFICNASSVARADRALTRRPGQAPGCDPGQSSLSRNAAATRRLPLPHKLRAISRLTGRPMSDRAAGLALGETRFKRSPAAPRILTANDNSAAID